ncbi:LacI family DNA-binding transcriptional regulator [Amycolatopsis thermoflava]|uniref:LacI family DNA-binding transcriptional regulator n=1 Tax=Amycolatopsis thermoflava TaxID=84480 RepID=UPI0036492D96
MTSGSGSRPTSADVARLAGVSRATVSYVLNGKDGHRVSEATRDKVLAAVRTLDYAPNAAARTLRAGHGDVVLMPLPSLPLSPPIDANIQHLDRELAERGLRLLLHGDRSGAGAAGVRSFAELRPAAVLLDAHRCTPSAVRLLTGAGAVVLAIGKPRSARVPYLPMDSVAVARLATRYLLDRGHRRLACLVPGPPLVPLSEPRFAAVAGLAADAGVPVERVDCHMDVDSLRPAVARWRGSARRRPTAVYAYNDEFALLLIEALRGAGLRVPGDIAVIGSGSFPMGAVLRPTLTTTHIPAGQIARAQASTVRRLLDGEPLNHEEMAAAMQPVLTVRESA